MDKRTCVILTVTSLVVCACCVLIGQYVVAGVMGLTAVAVRTGQYDGCEIAWIGPEQDGKWREEWLEPDPPAAARCKVYHKNRNRPEIAIARWKGFVGQTFDYDTKTWYISDFWEKLPDFMLAKCAKAAALRGAFPDQLSGVYIQEELESGVTEETEPIPADEDKYVQARAREAADKAAHPEQYVTSGPSPHGRRTSDKDPGVRCGESSRRACHGRCSAARFDRVGQR